MKKVLIHLGMGGHTAQILRLVDQLGSRYAFCYVIGDDDATSQRKIKIPGTLHIVKNPRHMKEKSLCKVVLRMVPTSWQIMRVLRKEKPDLVISAGPAMAIPLLWLAKMQGIKTVFIESWVRARSKSQAGRFVYVIADQFYVQWKYMKKFYPKALYRGRLS